GNINRFDLSAGSILADATVTSSLGDIKNLSISGGDLLGQVRAPHGQIQNLSIRGSDLGPDALVEAMVIRTLKLDGTVQAGASILATGELWSLIVGQDIQAGAIITAGAAKDIQVKGNLAASMNIGRGSWDSTKLTVSGDLGSTGSLIDIASGANVRVSGAILAGSTLSADGDVQLQVSGDVAGDVIAGGKIQRLSAGSLTDAVVTAGYDITALTVSGAVTRSLIQAGASVLTGTMLFDGGTSRSGQIQSLSIGSAVSSILAAGGNIKSFKSQSMTGSTLSSGLVLAGAAIDQVRDGTLDLAVAADRNTARQGVTLLRGDILALTGGDLVASQVSAGVDPGADGDFATDADNTVVTSLTGGSSYVKVQSVNLDAASRIVADGVIDARQSMGAGEANNASVTYSIADLTTNNPLSTYFGTATAGSPLTFVAAGVRTVTLTLTGPGSVDLYDEVGFDTDMTIGTLVLNGTTSASSLVMTTIFPGDVAIGRVLTADDATIGRFSFDGDLVGDASDDPDLWIDGPVNTLSFRNLGDDLAGRIGGDVNTLAFQTQGAGSLIVGGEIKSLIVVDSSGAGIFDDLAASPRASIRQMTTSDAGATWVFDTATRKIGQVDLTTGALVGSTFSVVDPLLSGAAAVLDVSAMDFGLDALSATRLLAVANALDLSPTVQVGPLTTTSATLRGMAVNAAGQVFAVDSSSGTDHLVRIDTTTGGIAEDRGQLRDIFGNTYSGHILALAFNSSGVLYGVTTDLDGNGSAKSTGDGAALVKLESSKSAGRDHLVVSGAGDDGLGNIVTGDAFTGSEVRGLIARTGGFYLVTNSGTASTLYSLTVTVNASSTDTVTASQIGAITAGGAAGIVGLGYDANGNLLGLSVIGGQASMIKIDTTTPASSALLSSAGVISPDIDALAIYTPTGGTPTTYAYDTDAAGGLFLTSPGVVATLGTIDTAAGPTQGQFDRLATLVKNAQGTPLGEAITAFAVAPGAAGHVFVVTQSGLLYEFDQDGALQNGGAIGPVVNQFTGQAMHIVGMGFNADGDLVGLDSLQNRLVTINTADAQAVPRMDIGVVPAANVHGLSYDPVEERFVALGPDDMLVELTATTQAEYELVQGKIQADSINRISITGSGYAGRIATTGNTVNSVQVQDDFAGQIAASSINSYSQRSGDFSGSLAVLQDIKQFQLSAGSILADGFVQAGGSIGRLSVKGDLAGSVDARTLSQLSVSGDVTSTARIVVTGELGSADVRGDFDGTLEAGSVRSNFKIGGELGATGLVSVDGDVQTLQVSDGIAAGGAIVIGGSAKTVRFSQTFAGALDVGMSVNSASFGTLSSAWVGIGRDLSSLTVSGDMLSSVVSVGTQVGPDGLYNTADDVILGGTLKRASIRGNVIDSALVAGVLPTIDSGPGIPASKFDYTADTASAGGIGRSTIGNVSVSQLVSGSALAAANGIDRVSGRHADQFSMRVLNDPLGAPTVVSIYQVSATEINVVFSEWIDLASVILSVDADGDQALTSPSDVIGSLSLINADGDYISADVALSVTTLNDEFSGTRSVLRIQRTGLSNFTNEGMVTVELAGSLNPDEPSVTDRTGRRSGLLNFNQHDDLARRVSDPFGTALGGGEDFSAQILTVEPPSAFSLVGSSMTLVVDQPLTFGQVFSSDRDIEIFRFDASAYEFFSWQIQSSAYVLGTLLFLDDQGTTDTADDTYETLAVPNFNGQTGLAYELPETGTYYLVLSPDYGTTPLTTYQLTMLLASSDDMLDGAINGQTGLPSGSIAYVSNTVGQHNNLLDANTPKQLIYLNFDGGRTAQYETNVDVAAFDPTLIDMDLAGYRDLFIAGGILNDVPITSIADLVASIYLDTPSASPLGSLNIQVLSGSDLSTFTSASSGLFLTTVDPSLSGLDPLVDFTTIYVGQTPSYWESAGTLGLANDIDVANMNKSGEAVILAQNFAGDAPSAGLVDKVLEYSRYLANVVAHELGHTLGLNHQPTNFFNYTLRQDDPANGLLSQMNGGVGVRLHAGDDIAITVHNGDVINLDLDGLLTVQDVVDLINSAGTDRVTASINSGSGRIELTDHTSGSSNFSVAFFIGSHAAPDLGIWANVSSTTDQIIGLSVLTMIEGNFGTGLMAYAPSNVEVSGLAQLGTADMQSSEFPIGQIDTFESLMRWLA
ncbi:MAG: hypothetical protein IT442_02950, partial [Phycisphaeraceae bacterium]|nr:hypothetical protein [Phycisphaeraceae bacterium]